MKMFSIVFMNGSVDNKSSAASRLPHKWCAPSGAALEKQTKPIRILEISPKRCQARNQQKQQKLPFIELDYQAALSVWIINFSLKDQLKCLLDVNILK